MKTKVLNKFKDAQIGIWKQEQVLHTATQKVLSDLLSSMTEEELKETGKLCIQLECEEATITTVSEVTPEDIVIEEFCELTRKNITDLNQHQQKQIIDEILINVFKI